jgi:fission process protein 1
MTSKNKNPESEVDLFRDTPLRYMGYANEVGESFRSLVSVSVVRASYVVAFGYVFADCVDKSIKTFKLEEAKPIEQKIESSTVKTAKVATDCLLWQTFASVLVPGFTINRLCKLSSILMSKSAIPFLIKSNKFLTTAIGLCSIPLIIHPIDHICHLAMDRTVRPMLNIEPHLKDK